MKLCRVFDRFSVASVGSVYERFEEQAFKSKAASGYCASEKNEFGPCCLTSSFPLRCGLPLCVSNLATEVVEPGEAESAKKAIWSGIAQLPYSSHKMSETIQPVTVDRVTGGMLEEFFVDRSLGVSGLSWLRSTKEGKEIGTYAPHGFASSKSTPDGVCCCADSIPLTILELKDSALDPFDAFGQAVASGMEFYVSSMRVLRGISVVCSLFVAMEASIYLVSFLSWSRISFKQACYHLFWMSVSLQH